MPTEHELKYVIEKDSEQEISKSCSEQYFISQGYLIATRGITVRVRKSVKKSNGVEKYYFTLKANAGGRCVEIEKNIDKRDFDDLWSLSLNQLEKIRYIIKDDKNVWELDFFKDYSGKTYMAVAEIELPEDQESPNRILEIVEKNLIYKVPLTDTRFSNKFLSNAKYAVDLVKEIQKEMKNEV